ncbi:MAG: tetraacyldisaccharide 4'-kinase [Planctomycetaceae bacterium]|jgi:tetraacyldisaccharide 4'-kinase|nr:tetraacyldisaccharide 4'-kinase [Planctomycetaceae bacterium]
MREEWFRQLVSGEKRGIGVSFLRIFLFGVSIIYWIVTSIRNFLYDFRILKIHKVDIPVISVGNITLGGTGKSPMVAWLCEYFISQGLRPAIISRGYRRQNANNSINADDELIVNEINGFNRIANANDEYLELAFRLPDVYHFQNKDRVVAIRELLRFVSSESSRGGVDIVILDDGMQHRRLGRDFEIVLLDAMEPFGYGHIFPRGRLRESLTGLSRADVILLSKANCISAEERNRIAKTIRKIASRAIYAEVIHEPKKILFFNGKESDVNEIGGKRIFAFCGIGNPASFYSILHNNFGDQIHFEQYPDHYEYSRENIIEIIQKAESLKVDLILCTMKDFVKIDQILRSENQVKILDSFKKIPFAALIIQIKFLTNEQLFQETLNKM